ncbi:MAG: hypothetical protein QGI49_08055 [SAR202 cluster bacterium]|jgi:hypothetical protein|nr:hypothetical protein [SAR202 cluster bacterium]
MDFKKGSTYTRDDIHTLYFGSPVPDTFAPVPRVVGALSHPDKRWFGEQPPIPGRYGAYHAQDIFGWGRQSLAGW